MNNAIASDLDALRTRSPLSFLRRSSFLGPNEPLFTEEEKRKWGERSHTEGYCDAIYDILTAIGKLEVRRTESSALIVKIKQALQQSLQNNTMRIQSQ